MPAPFSTQRMVEFGDTDAAGLAHFSTFFAWMEQAEHELLRSLGLSVMMCDDDGRLSWPRVNAACDFHSPVRFEDRVDVEVRLDRLGTSSVTYAFRFSIGDREVATGTMTSVCCRISMTEPPQAVTIPDQIAVKLAALREK